MTVKLAKSPFWYLLKPVKEGWCVGLGQAWVPWGWGNYRKYLKRGWNRKKGRGNKDFKKGEAGSRGGCLKKRAGLRTMDLVSGKEPCSIFSKNCLINAIRHCPTEQYPLLDKRCAKLKKDFVDGWGNVTKRFR